MSTRREVTFRNVVLIADHFDRTAVDSETHARRDLEMTDGATLRTLCEAIASLGLHIYHYDNLDQIAKHYLNHKDDIVLSIYGGQTSRNRMALVPALCEALSLRFVGPDVYGRIVAQDKEISKRLAVDCGLRTPAWRVVRSVAELNYACGLSLPVVVKPLFEGSSIGISQKSRACSASDVSSIVAWLLSTFSQPVIIEEFVAGREVAYCRIQNGGEDAWAFSEVVIDNDPHYFNNRVFDAEEKLNPTRGRTVRNIDMEISTEDRLAIERFLVAFGNYGYCRVDGRLENGRFHFIELTPDAWIAPKGQFARAFTEKGWDYPSIIAAVLASAY